MSDGDKPQTTAVATKPEMAVVVDEGMFANLMDSARFAHIQRVGRMFANSSLVPEHFRGKEADCVIAVEMAMRLKLHPFNLMQSLYVVHGKPGIEAKMAIALINSSGLFQGPLQFKLEGEGMKRQCTAFAAHTKTGQVCETTVTMEMAKAEGWIDKSGSKWKTLPDLMLQYRSASFFSRLYCPEVVFGMQTKEDLDDIAEIAVNEAPARPAKRTLHEHLGIVDAETPSHAPPAPASSTQAAAPIPEAQPAPKAPQSAHGEPPIPFKDVSGMLKKAKTREQGEILLDTLNDVAYSDEQRKEGKALFDERFPVTA